MYVIVREQVETWGDTLSIDISVSDMSIMVSVLSTPETRKGLLNYHVYKCIVLLTLMYDYFGTALLLHSDYDNGLVIIFK